MDEKEDIKLHRSILPEALHPEIGNGALWEPQPHFINLRSADPSVGIDFLLHDEQARKSILSQWDKNATPNENDAQRPDVEQEGVKKSKSKTKKKAKKIHSVLKAKETTPEWMLEENIEAIATNGEPSLSNEPEKLEDVENIPVSEPAPKPEPVVGKRVRKALKTINAEEIKAKTDKISRHAGESGLSPFTRWLKGLKGSEYVHPYEDDYALGKLSDATKDGISETFADLLAAQGYKDQAMDMYRLLMAKYPEKSSFFAAKIEELK